jgi:Tol biopolymer transport system component
MRSCLRPFAVLGALMVLGAGCADSTDPTGEAQPTMSLAALTPRALLGFAGTDVNPTPEVRVLDAGGEPVPGAMVTFEVMSGGGSLEGAEVPSDADGKARLGRWVLGPGAGVNVVRARLSGGAALDVLFMTTGQARCETPCASDSRLAFVRDGDIFALNEDGSLVRLTDNGEFTDPVWSPDGSRIAAVHRYSLNHSVIYLIHVDGSALAYMTPGRAPAWSPDGTRIAYVGPDGGILVQTVNQDDTPRIRLGFDRGYHDWPAWSPDGARIAFISDWLAFNRAFDVFEAAVDGSEIRHLTDGFNQGAWTVYAQPDWAPDGSGIAVVTCPGSDWGHDCTESQVGIIGADGSGFRLLATTTGLPRPRWSPDGSEVSFSRVCPDGWCQPDLLRVAAVGGPERLIIANGHSSDWRP